MDRLSDLTTRSFPGRWVPNVGVLCLTLCPHCAKFRGDPPIAVATAVRLVRQHATHLGINVRQMEVQLRIDSAR